MEKISVDYINSRYFSAKDYLEDDESYLEKIREVGDKIVLSRGEKPIILLSGPSGSGKTTTAQFLEKYLDGIGIETHTVSLDNYFTTVGGRKVDYESPSRINAELLSDNIEKLLNCESVRLPIFDFKSETSLFSDTELKRKDGELVIFEGTHALNPEVVRVKRGTSRIYIDVSTVITYQNGVIDGEHIRLMRRIFRDSIYRGRSALTTLKYFKSVEDGTKKYLEPFKRTADYELNSFTPYETALYKEVITKELVGVKESLNGDDLLLTEKLLDYLRFVSAKDLSSVPKNSIIREFIG